MRGKFDLIKCSLQVFFRKCSIFAGTYCTILCHNLKCNLELCQNATYAHVGVHMVSIWNSIETLMKQFSDFEQNAHRLLRWASFWKLTTQKNDLSVRSTDLREMIFEPVILGYLSRISIIFSHITFDEWGSWSIIYFARPRDGVLVCKFAFMRICRLKRHTWRCRPWPRKINYALQSNLFIRSFFVDCNIWF